MPPLSSPCISVCVCVWGGIIWSFENIGTKSKFITCPDLILKKQTKENLKLAGIKMMHLNIGPPK